MKTSRHHDLLVRVAKRLNSEKVSTDYLLTTRWCVLTLAQYLAGAPAGEAETVSAHALELYGQQGPGRRTDAALRRATAAVAATGESTTESVLPQLTSTVREDVILQLRKYATFGQPVVARATRALPTVRGRLARCPTGALSAGLQHRLELVARIACDPDRSATQRLRAASAILYLDEIHDAIPDTLGHIGLVDDDFAFRVVLDEIGEHDAHAQLHWAERIASLWTDLPFLRGVDLRRDDRAITTTWFERLNSYVAYRHALNRSSTPLVLVQPSVACAPLHTIVTLMGLAVLDGLTSSGGYVEPLVIGQVYEVDGRFRVQYDGTIEGSPAPGWLRLKFDRSVVALRPPAIAARMRPVAGGWLSQNKGFPPVNVHDAEPIQKFFGWPEAIGATAIPARVMLVTSKQRATALFGRVESNGLSCLDNGLVRLVGLTPDADEARTALVLVVPTLRVARELLDLGIDACAVVIDGYNRLSQGRHDLPFFAGRSSPPPIITWSANGDLPDEKPAWLSPHRRLGVDAAELAHILELDDELDESRVPLRESLLEAATFVGIERFESQLAPAEVDVVQTIDAFLQELRASEAVPTYWKYYLFSTTTILRGLVVCTPASWQDIRSYSNECDEAFRERYDELTPRGRQDLAFVMAGRRSIKESISAVSCAYNSRVSDLVTFLEHQQSAEWHVVLDRPEHVRALGRVVRCRSLPVRPVLVQDLDVCQQCIVIGWRNLQLGRRLRAHTPQRVVALATDDEWTRWKRLELYATPARDGSLLEVVGGAPPVGPARHGEPSTDVLEEEEAEEMALEKWRDRESADEVREKRVACIFVWPVDEPRGKVLARDGRVLVSTGGQAGEKIAHRVTTGDNVILGAGSRRWSPADEFTQHVVLAVDAARPDVVRKAREWRVALRKLRESQNWTIEQLQRRLEGVGVHRELPTVDGWLRLEKAAPIRPQAYRTELPALWKLVGRYAERSCTEVVEACRNLHGLHRAARNVLFDSETRDLTGLGIDEEKLGELVQRIRQEMDVHMVDSTGEGRVPESMIGWWITPDIAEGFAATPNS